VGLLYERNENVKQLFYTNVCSIVMGQYGPKHLAIDVLQYYCNFNTIVCICSSEL